MQRGGQGDEDEATGGGDRPGGASRHHLLPQIPQRLLSAARTASLQRGS